MKTPVIFIYFLLITISFSFAQRTTSKTVKVEAITTPTISVSDFTTLSLKVYFPNNTVNKDTIRKYAGNIDILKTDSERLTGTSYFSTKQTNMVNENADIQVIVAFNKPIFIGKELKEGKSPYYLITHSLPTKVKILNKNGNVLDYWTEASQNTIQFGNEQIEYSRKKDGVNTFTMRNLSHLEYDQLGEVMINKRAIMWQLRKVIESLNDKIYYNTKKYKFDIASAAGKNFDYTALDQSQKNALEAIKNQIYTNLSNEINVWNSYIEQASQHDKKSMINPNIASGLSGNITISHYLMGDLVSAKEASINYLNLSRKSTKKKTVNGRTQAEILSELVERKIKEEAANGKFIMPTKTYKAIDIKREIGRKNKNEGYNFIINEDIFDGFEDGLGLNNNMQSQNETNESFDNQVTDALQDMVEKNKTGDYDYTASVQSTPTQGVILIMDYFRFSGIVDKPFPEEICEITELNQIMANNMKFTELPKNIGDLSTLNKLVLKGSNLKEIPDSIGNLALLKRLDLSNNQLTSLPESIQNCKVLKTLILKGNKISSREIEKIKTLIPSSCKLKI